MLEIFSLSSRELGLSRLCSRDDITLWSAGSDVVAAPDVFGTQEGCLLLLDGRLRLDSGATLEGPTLAVLPPARAPRIEPLDARLRALLWSLYGAHPAAPGRASRIILHAGDLTGPRTVTGATSILHWLPRLDSVERRTLAGAPTLLLNLGQSAVPLVAGGELVPLGGDCGAVFREVVTMRLGPGSGPVVAVEQIVPE